MKIRVILRVLIVLLAGGVSAFGLYVLQNTPPEPRQISTGKALIGGPFTLTDHTGRRVTEKDFKGRFMLVFFGYTSCPDICPAEMQVISAALDELGKKGELVSPLFITVDPERDTPARLKSYLSNFHKRLVGLTGSPEEIRAVTRAYKVFYEKMTDDPASADYAMDHSSIVYLMSPEGEYLTNFKYGTGVDKMARGIAKFL